MDLSKKTICCGSNYCYNLENDLMKPKIVFAIYKPHQDKGNELKKLILKHVPRLKSNKLITNREPLLVKSKNGIYIEIFEWKSTDAVEEAHENPEIQKLWDEIEKVCDFTNLESIEEVREYFPQFKPIK